MEAAAVTDAVKRRFRDGVQNMVGDGLTGPTRHFVGEAVKGIIIRASSERCTITSLSFPPSTPVPPGASSKEAKKQAPGTTPIRPA